MKTLRLLLMLFVALTFQACSLCEDKLVYVDREVYVNVPVKCIVPYTDCSIDNNASDGEIVIALVKCIIDMKETRKVCR